jgi:polygalacturonase
LRSKRYLARDFGAAADGITDDTSALQAALDRCARDGGGTVALTAGVYMTAPLRLHSNIALEIERDAVLLGTPNIEDRVLDGWPAGVIYAKQARNVTITGRGTIDGNYRHFFDFDRTVPATYFRDFDPAAVRGGRGFDEQASVDGPVMPQQRPGNMIVFADCEDVLVEGVTMIGSSMWTLHCADCRGVTIRDLSISTDPLCYNTDGIHLTDCRKVAVTNCDITTGDDCIAISGQRGTSADRHHAAWEPEISLGFGYLEGLGEDISVSDCHLSSKSSAVRIWSLQSSVRNVRLERLSIRDTNRGIGIFLRSPHTIRDVTISDVEVETRFHTGAWWGWAEPLHISATPLPGAEVDGGCIERIHVERLRAHAQNGIVLVARGPSVIRGISLEDISLTIREGAHSSLKAGHLDLRNTVTASGITQRPAAGLMAVNIESLRARDVVVTYPDGLPPHFVPGPQLENIRRLELERWSESYAGRGNAR